MEDTNKFLATAKEDLKKSKYALKEKDYIISEQRKAGLYTLAGIFEVSLFLGISFIEWQGMQIRTVNWLCMGCLTCVKAQDHLQLRSLESRSRSDMYLIAKVHVLLFGKWPGLSSPIYSQLVLLVLNPGFSSKSEFIKESEIYKYPFL